MADLRTRIAKTLHRLYGPSLGAALDWDSEPEKTRQMYLNDADEVIRELGLRIEYGALDANNCGRSSDYDELTALPGETIKTRFITDWTTKNA